MVNNHGKRSRHVENFEGDDDVMYKHTNEDVFSTKECEDQQPAKRTKIFSSHIPHAYDCGDYIYIKSITGTMMYMHNYPTVTVSRLRSHASLFFKVPTHLIRIVHMGRLLSDDNRCLSDYGINHKDTIVIILDLLQTKVCFVKRDTLQHF
ncbi:hypothetical protein AKO1_001043 [Acrasis kona]|uniref:Ubiquitin-like domain-containing protein n=1 Tax=Acrasis kona TaxID=1008807 RepID=A0AAW2ZDC6_9EUKA